MALKVLQVLPRLDSGGVERGTVDVARYVKHKGGTPHVISAGGRLVDTLIRHGIAHETMPVHSKNIFTMRDNIERIYAYVKAHSIDIVHVRSRAPAWTCYWLKRKYGIPLVTTFHGVYNFSWKLKKYYNSVMCRGDKLVAVSEHIKQHMHQVYGCSLDDIKVIHRGVDCDVFTPKSATSLKVLFPQHPQHISSPFYVLLPGRITRWKGHETLIRALSRIPHIPWTCLMVGSLHNTAYANELETLGRKLNIHNRIFRYPTCTDMPSLYSCASVIVSASTDPEAFGRVMAEGGAMEKIVVATDHGGAQEIIEEGKTGFLYPVGDDVALASILERVYNLDASVRSSMEKAARSRVCSLFSNTQFLEKIYGVYEELYHETHTSH